MKHHKDIYLKAVPFLFRLRVVSSFPLGDRRESTLERWESAQKVGRGQIKARGGRGEVEKEMEKRRLQTTHCWKICAAVGDLSILIGQFWLFRQQVSRDDGISSFSECYDGLQFREGFKIETTTIFSMLHLENLPQKKLGFLAVNKK